MKKLSILMMIFLIMSLGVVSYGTAIDTKSLSFEDQLQNIVVLPIDYNDKVFTGGNYVSISEPYQVELKKGRTYLPIRLMTYVLSKDGEYWQAHWEPHQPDVVHLYGQEMKSLGDGGWIGGDKMTAITLQVGSKIMIYNGQQVELSDAPEKIGGRIMLPVRALGEALKKQVAYKKGLVFISNDPIRFEGTETDVIINELKERLKDTRKPLAIYHPSPETTNNIEGKTYYLLIEYDETKQMPVQRLYSKEEGKSAILKKEIFNDIYIQEPLVNNTYYYIKEDQNSNATLFALDLVTMLDTPIADIQNEVTGSSWVGRIIPQGEQIFFTSHYGDLNMGSQTLYAIENGEVSKLTSAKYFGSLIFQDNKIYCSSMNPHSFANNLFVYDFKTKSTTKLGEEGYAYDMNRVMEGGAVSVGISNSMTILDGKLYTVGYREDRQEVPALYTIDLLTGTTKKLTESTSKFWIIEEQVYYIDSKKQFYSVDLEGKNPSIVIEDPISQIRYEQGDFYYTLDKGLYQYDVNTNTHMMLINKKVKKFFVHPSRVYAITSGYDGGVYKFEDGAVTYLSEFLSNDYSFDGEKLIFHDIYEGVIKDLR